MQVNVRSKQIIRTSIIGIITNVVLAGFKAVVGLLSHSIAIVLDAVNNLTDALSSVITVFSARLAGKPADRKHPYGHGRYEYIGASIIAVIILYAGVTALSESIKSLIHPETPDYSTVSLIVVAVATVVKILLGRYVKGKGKKLDSDSLKNSGQDALQDALISATTLVAAVLFIFFKVSLEAWLGIIISLIIIRSGIEMIRTTVSKLLGERAESHISQAIKETICETEGVIGAYDLIMNSYGPDQWVCSAHIEVPDTWTADKIDAVSREIFHRVAEKNHVIMAAIGIYSQNSDENVKRMHNAISELVLSEEYVIQMHGFYCDTEEKTIRFDLVIDFTAPDPHAVCKDLENKVSALFPEYTVYIQQDIDFSD